MTKMIVDHHAM